MATTKVKTRARKRTRHVLDDSQGRPAWVVLPIEEYEALMEAAEDFADLRAADEARAEAGESTPWEQVKAEWQAKRKSH